MSRRHRPRVRPLVVIIALLLAGCTSADTAAEDSAPPPTPAAPETREEDTPTGTPPEASPGTTAGSGVAAIGVSGVPQPDAATDIATGLNVPWDMAFLPDGSALVTLRDEARVVRVAADGTTTPVTADGEDGRVADVDAEGEGGLLGVTTAAKAQEVYLYISASDENRVVRYAWDQAGNTLTDPVTVIGGIPRAEVHNGGRIDIGPDGLLYVATGDARDTEASPDRASLAGKILRVTTDGAPAPGNPDPASPVWSLGHRNVQGLGWSPDGTMWASEFGQNTTDELNVIEAGTDYGWPQVEGAGGVEGLRDPVATWRTDEASPSGITVTDDAVYVAGLGGQRLWRVPIAGGQVAGEPQAFLTGELGRLRHVEVAPDGSLWLLTNNTARGEPRAGDDRIVRLPLG